MKTEEYYKGLERYLERYLDSAPTVTAVRFLESRPKPARKVDAACTLSPAAIRARSRRQSITDAGASSELGEGRARIGNQSAWAVRQLRLGGMLSRYGWALEPEPKRLSLELRVLGTVEVLLCRYTGAWKVETFSTLTWADVSANDWYLVKQLELTK